MQIMPDINNHLFIQLGIGRSAAVNAMFLQSLDLKNKKKETSLLCRDRHYFRFVAELSHERYPHLHLRKNTESDVFLSLPLTSYLLKEDGGLLYFNHETKSQLQTQTTTLAIHNVTVSKANNGTFTHTGVNQVAVLLFDTLQNIHVQEYSCVIISLLWFPTKL